jgi:nicotinamidase-related amidase
VGFIHFVAILIPAFSINASFGLLPSPRLLGHDLSILLMSGADSSNNKSNNNKNSNNVAIGGAKLDPSAAAFVFIEYQNEFCSPGGKLHDAVKDCMEQTNMLENSIKAMTAAREAGCTIIHCPIDFEPGHPEISKTPYGVLAGIKEGGAFTSGQWGADFVAGMRPAPGDLVVEGKKGLCGFASTNLEFLLGQSGARNLVLAGFLTNCCVESTMRYVRACGALFGMTQ